MTEILKVEKLNFSYNGKKIFSNISFSINEGDYLGLIGENGRMCASSTIGVG